MPQHVPRHVWLVRHDNRLDFAEPAWRSTAAQPYDPPLAADGVVQAQETARRLAGEDIQHIFSSPFRRTLETAAVLGAARGLAVKVEAEFCEYLNPAWFPVAPVFRPLTVLADEYPCVDRSYRSPPPPRFPETQDQAFARFARAIARVLAACPGNLLVVGHGASLIGTTTALLGQRPAELFTAFCSIIQIEQQPDGSWRLLRDGRDTSHLTRADYSLGNF